MGVLEGKVAIVTGAGGGIGRATCVTLAREGARLVCADLFLAGAQAAADAVTAAGGDAIAVQSDLAREADSIALVEQAMAHYGRIDILHNNAADQSPEMSPAHDKDIETTDARVWQTAFTVNALGTALMCKHAIPHMVAGGGGSIINTTSNLGLQGNVVQIAYAASKAAILQFSRSIAASHGRKGIRCNTVSPGLTLTPAVLAHVPPPQREAVEAETLLPFLGSPEDIANAVLFLASDASRSVTGHNLVVDGGTSTHVPGFERLYALPGREPRA